MIFARRPSGHSNTNWSIFRSLAQSSLFLPVKRIGLEIQRSWVAEERQPHNIQARGLSLPACALALGHLAGTKEAVSKTQESQQDESDSQSRLEDLVISPSLPFFPNAWKKIQPLLSEM